MKKILLATFLLLGVYIAGYGKTKTTIPRQKKTITKKKSLTAEQKDSISVAKLTTTSSGYYILNTYIRSLTMCNDITSAVAYRACVDGSPNLMTRLAGFEVNPAAPSNLVYTANFFISLKKLLGEDSYYSCCIECTGSSLRNIQAVETYVFMKTGHPTLREQKRMRIIEEKRKAEEEKKRTEITSKTYDLKQYNLPLYNKLANDARQKIFNAFYTIPGYYGGYKDREHVVIFEYDRYHGRVLLSNYDLAAVVPKIRYTDSCIAHYSTKYDASQSHRGDNTKLRFDGTTPSTFYDEFSIRFGGDDFKEWVDTDVKPNLKIGGYEVRTKADFPIVIDFAMGVSTVRIKKEKLLFEENIPDEDLVERVKKEIYEHCNMPKLRGVYLVYYGYVNVMGNSKIDIRVMKKSSINKAIECK